MVIRSRSNIIQFRSAEIIDPGGDSYFLDDYPQALLHLSFRQMRTGQTLCYRIRRNSDNDELDIGFVDGVVDVATAEAFCGAGNGFLSRWYGAGMGGYEAYQNTASNQPQIVSNGTHILYNDKPSAFYNGTSHNLDINDDANLRQVSNYSIFAIAAKTTTASGTFFAKSSGTSSGNSMYVLDTANTALRFVVWEAAGTARVCSSSGRRADVLELHEGHHIPGSPPQISRWRDGELLNSTNTIDPLFSNEANLQIGVRGTTARHAGYVSEVQITNTHNTAFNSAYRANVESYYGITMI